MGKEYLAHGARGYIQTTSNFTCVLYVYECAVLILYDGICLLFAINQTDFTWIAIWDRTKSVNYGNQIQG